MQSLSALLQIDYQTFLTLSDEDLKEVGVSTFGARRKMLLAISGESLKSQLGLMRYTALTCSRKTDHFFF